MNLAVVEWSGPEPPRKLAPKLARTQRGTMIHRADCRHAANGTPWLWARNKTLGYIARIVCEFGYRTCHVCKPIPGELIGMWSI